MTTQSKELALDDREYELLLEGCRRIPDDRQAREARFAVLVAGRLGLRAGEIVHMREEWIDWRSRWIKIPSQQTCQKGKHGGTCGYCRQAAEQMVEFGAISEPEARLELLQEETYGFRQSTERDLLLAHRRYVDGDLDDSELAQRVDDIIEESAAGEWGVYESLAADAEERVAEQDISYETALGRMWQPKTEAAAREIPFDWSARVEICIERFFDVYSAWPLSKTGLTRRVTKALEYADEITTDDTHLHGLRATAASHHAGRGVSTLSLQSLMGWSQPSTARNYVTASPEATQRELHQSHSG